MKYSFAYEVSIADKLGGKKQGAIEQNSEGFSTISDDIDHRGASQNYRYAKAILPLWGSAEIQGYG
jgi:hypothetical protein